MTKLVKLFIIFGPVQHNNKVDNGRSQIKVLKKYANQAGQSIDESLMSTLCLPQVEFVDEPREPRFQTFLVTKEDGQMLYGSGLIVYEPIDSHQEPSDQAPHNSSVRSNRAIHSPSRREAKQGLASKELATDDQPKKDLVWEKKCDDNIIMCIMNIPLPARRACLRIVPPPPSSFDQPSSRSSWLNSFNSNSTSGSSMNLSADSYREETSLVNESNNQGQQISNMPKRTSNFTSSNNPKYIRHKLIDDIYLYRGLADLPILDYPLRELFSFLQIDDLLLAFACILMEFRTLIISQDNYKLMMVGETLTTLLLPLKWCNVYVPILPPEYGATYLDAPTSYIMGINTQVTELPENLNHVQCRIYCDESRVVCDADSLALPLFLNDIKKDILKIFDQHQLEYEPIDQYNSLELDSQRRSSSSPVNREEKTTKLGAGAPSNCNGKPFTYLDDLKFNRAIRVLFINTIRKNILANYERYIVDVPESSKEIRQFDVVSYLSDQPEFMHTFLSKFLDTQLFVSFIDENAKRIQQSWLSIFDMDPESLSEHFTDEILELAFKKAQRVQLKNLAASQQTGDIEIKTVPASPMKLRQRLPGLTSIRNRLQNLATTKSAKFASSNFSSIDQSEISSGSSSAGVLNSSPPSPFDLSGPVIHRNSIANISLKGHLKAGNYSPTMGTLKETSEQPPLSHQKHPTLANLGKSVLNGHSNGKAHSHPAPNGKIIELINEVKDLTKGILVESMGAVGDVMPLGRAFTSKPDIGSCDGIALIGSLCDLIERVWAHGAFTSSQENGATAGCPLWNHLMAFARLKFLESNSNLLSGHHEFSDGSHLNVLSPPIGYKSKALSELDMLMMLERGRGTQMGGRGGTASEAIKSSLKWFRSTGKRDRSQLMNLASRELINDLIIINKLEDVKTGFGKARAFIRLSLERKQLCKHLKTLLTDQALLESLYKTYAFLRHDDEREQFLMYLLTLNAVDLPCFTNTFVNVINTRRMKLST